MARQCLINTLEQRTSNVPSKRRRKEKSPSVISVYMDNQNTHEKPRPVERYKEVDVFEGKSIKIGKDLPETVK